MTCNRCSRVNLLLNADLQNCSYLRSSSSCLLSSTGDSPAQQSSYQDKPEMGRPSRSSRGPLLIRLTVPEGANRTADGIFSAVGFWSEWIGLAAMATRKRLVRLGN